MLGAEPGYHTELVRLGAPGLVSEAEASRRETLVRRSPLFAGLTASECREIVSAAHEKHFARRQTIFVKGDLVQQVILLTSGAAKTVQFTASRAEVILGLRGPGELVGTVGLRPQDRHHLMAQALVSSAALVWDAAAFEAFSQRSMHLRCNITHILCQQLHELEERYREIATEKVAARLSLQFVRLIPRVGRRVDGGIEIRLTRKELAQLTGTTLFTVSRLLSDWNQRGIVRTQREAVLVDNLEALAQLSEGAQDRTSGDSTGLNRWRRARTPRCGNDAVFAQVGRINTQPFHG